MLLLITVASGYGVYRKVHCFFQETNALKDAEFQMQLKLNAEAAMARMRSKHKVR